MKSILTVVSTVSVLTLVSFHSFAAPVFSEELLLLGVSRDCLNLLRSLESLEIPKHSAQHRAFLASHLIMVQQDLFPSTISRVKYERQENGHVFFSATSPQEAKQVLGALAIKAPVPWLILENMPSTGRHADMSTWQHLATKVFTWSVSGSLMGSFSLSRPENTKWALLRPLWAPEGGLVVRLVTTDYIHLTFEIAGLRQENGTWVIAAASEDVTETFLLDDDKKDLDESPSHRDERRKE